MSEQTDEIPIAELLNQQQAVFAMVTDGVIESPCGQCGGTGRMAHANTYWAAAVPAGTGREWAEVTVRKRSGVLQAVVLMRKIEGWPFRHKKRWEGWEAWEFEIDPVPTVSGVTQ